MTERLKRNITSTKSATVKLLFADDQAILFITEDKLQKDVNKLNQITTEHGVNVTAEKTKLMAFKGRDSFRS